MPLSRRKWQRVLLGWIIAFTLLTFYAIRENRQLAEKGEDARTAICALKQDLRVRINNARQFLVDNPNGIPGIPASVIKQSIANQAATVRALDVIDCDLPDLPPPADTTTTERTTP